MKKILLVAAAAAGLASIAPAFAADGTLNINGNVTTTACKVTTTGGNITVALPNVTTTALSAAGNTAGQQPFSINLTTCPNNTVVSTYFEPNTDVDFTTGNLKNKTSGGATNVQIALYNGDMTKIDLGKAAGAQNSKSGTIVSGSGALNYYAGYVATGAATAGVVNTSVTFSMIYP